MNTLPVGVVLGAPIVCDLLRTLPAGASLEEVARAAMKYANDARACFMCRNDDEQFRTGVGGLLLFYKGNAEVTERVEREMKMLAALSASMSGIPVDMSRVIDEDAPEPLGLLGMFREAKEARPLSLG